MQKVLHSICMLRLAWQTAAWQLFQILGFQNVHAYTLRCFSTATRSLWGQTRCTTALAGLNASFAAICEHLHDFSVTKQSRRSTYHPTWLSDLQFWEMYRFRNGQRNQLNIDFAYGGRLLSKYSALMQLEYWNSVTRSIATHCCWSTDKLREWQSTILVLASTYMQL